METLQKGSHSSERHQIRLPGFGPFEWLSLKSIYVEIRSVRLQNSLSTIVRATKSGPGGGQKEHKGKKTKKEKIQDHTDIKIRRKLQNEAYFFCYLAQIQFLEHME